MDDVMGPSCMQNNNCLFSNICFKSFLIDFVTFAPSPSDVFLTSGLILISVGRILPTTNKFNLKNIHLMNILLTDSDDSERPEFLKHLVSLRREAPVFLAMLNETRRQVRELRRPNRNDSTIQAYKSVFSPTL